MPKINAQSYIYIMQVIGAACLYWYDSVSGCPITGIMHCGLRQIAALPTHPRNRHSFYNPQKNKAKVCKLPQTRLN